MYSLVYLFKLTEYLFIYLFSENKYLNVPAFPRLPMHFSDIKTSNLYIYKIASWISAEDFYKMKEL